MPYPNNEDLGLGPINSIKNPIIETQYFTMQADVPRIKRTNIRECSKYLHSPDYSVTHFKGNGFTPPFYFVVRYNSL